MKLLNLILAIIFLAFALLQINDPDPYLWIALYGGIALLFGFAAFGQYRKWPILAGLVVCVFELASLMPAFVDWMQSGMPSITETMHAETPHVELVREFLGLAIALVGLIFLYFRYRAITLSQLRTKE